MITEKELNVSELDFNKLVENFQNFLRNRKNEKGELIFTDFDYEGSNLRTLIEMLSYNTFYMGFYANQVANESFLDSAIKRSSVVSKAKELNYVPRSSTCAKAELKIINTKYSETDYILKDTLFYGRNDDGQTVPFSILHDLYYNKNSLTGKYESNVNIYQGIFLTKKYIKQYNTDKFFEIPNQTVDVDKLLLRVRVFPHEGSETYEEYQRSDSIISLNEESAVYFIQENYKGNYEIYFGNGLIGKLPQLGSIIEIRYFFTQEEAGNNITSFFSSDLSGKCQIKVIASSYGGQTKESIESIRYLAPRNYEAQQRCVTANDFITTLKTKYRTIKDISVWGGEEENPPHYGKVFISILPQKNYIYTEFQKKKILQDLILSYNVMTIKPEIVDPDFIYVFLNSVITYSSNSITVTTEELSKRINDAIVGYFENSLNVFNSNLIYNKLTRAIESVHDSILSCNIDFTLEKRFVHDIPADKTINKKKYILNFGNIVKPGSIVSSTLILGGVAHYIKDIPDSYESATTGTIVLYRPLTKTYIKRFSFTISHQPTVLTLDSGVFLPQYSQDYQTGDYQIKIIIPSVQSRKYGYTVGDLVNGSDISIEMSDQFSEISKTISVSVPECVGATVEMQCVVMTEEINIINASQGTIDYASGTLILDRFYVTDYTESEPIIRIKGKFGIGSNLKTKATNDLTIYANGKNQIIALSDEKSKITIRPR